MIFFLIVGSGWWLGKLPSIVLFKITLVPFMELIILWIIGAIAPFPRSQTILSLSKLLNCEIISFV